MSATLPPGIGNDAQVNQANQWLREQPWYQDLLRSWGQNPQNVHLSDAQREQLLNIARTRGVGISNDYEMDESGNIHDKGMSGWKKALLIGGGAAGALFGVPGLFPGLLTAGGGAAAGTTAASSLAGVEGGAWGLPASSAAMLPGAVAAPTTAGTLAAIEGGAWGLPSSVASQLPGATGIDAILPSTSRLGSKIGKTTAGGTDLARWAKLAGLIAPTAAGIIGRNGSSNQPTPIPGALTDILDTQASRIKQAQPLYDVMLNYAMGMTPQWARNGKG